MILPTPLYRGYDPLFLTDAEVRTAVPLPVLGARHRADVAPVAGSDRPVVDYINYSVQMSASRKFPFYAAANIDGALFQKAARAKGWRKDARIKDYQWGTELYSAEKSDFDKGHMTKREDVQWGPTVEDAQLAADSTFYYSNAVPQHKLLNQRIWKKLEDYILKRQTRPNSLRICVFTGPVLSERDPAFVTAVRDQQVRLPVLFWKVVYFVKSDQRVYRVGFIMSQRKLIEHYGMIEELERFTPDDQLFMQFDEFDTYQVNVSLIETLTGLTLAPAVDSYTDERSARLVLREVEVDPELESWPPAPALSYAIENLTL